MIRLNVFIKLPAQEKAHVLAAARALVSASLKDDGCVAYDIFESATREDVLMFCETWKDEASLIAHENTAHFKKLVPEIAAVATLKIEKFVL